MSAKPERKRPGAATVRPTLEAKREELYTGTREEVTPEKSDATPPVKKASTKKPVSFQADTELIDRARQAVLLTQAHPGGYRSLASFMESAIADKLEQVAKEFNSGQPIEPLSGEFRSGRPFQS